MPILNHKQSGGVSTLHIVLGDQLDLSAPALRALDVQRDAILMMEVAGEAVHVPSHKQRTVLFLSAMRHFARELVEQGYQVRYVTLTDEGNTQSLDGEVRRAVSELHPERLSIVRPGEWRLWALLDAWREDLGIDLLMHEDAHFYTTPQQFSQWADGRKVLRMETFYRKQRRDLAILMDGRGEPEGGAWNYDKENRKPLKSSLADLPARKVFTPDAMTREVIELVESRFPDAPGTTESFGWPVTHAQAGAALRHFVRRGLADFGAYQDAMRSGAPWVYHSLLSPVLNLKLLDPRQCVEAAVKAYAEGRAPLNSVEGFVRQIIGWREFIRGIYWRQGPDYGSGNSLQESGRLPSIYWSGETSMRCMQQSLGQVMEHGYGHHIQRLMVTGNFALIAGVKPAEIRDWYLAMYVDAVDWVTTPNTVGMVMHADGGIVGSKPYAASGAYIKRMSDYCSGCTYDPAVRSGGKACPFTVFYWDFLLRHRQRFKSNPRMGLALANLKRLSPADRRALQLRADAIRRELGIISA